MISRSRLALLCIGAAVMVSSFGPAGAEAVAAGKIEGKVVDSGTKVGIEDVEVCALEPPEFEFAACDLTGADGEYVLEGLADGSYVVEFWAPYLGYVSQYFDGTTSFEDADEVTIAGGGTVSNVDAELEQGGEIEGRVTAAASGAGIEEVEVCAYSLTAFGGCAFTDFAGDYTIAGVPTGSYVVEFWAEFLGYQTRYYDEGSSFEDANLVAVFAPDTTTGIDARLSKPAAHVVLPPSSGAALLAPAPAPAVVKPKPKPRCKKGFKRVKRHGRIVCVKKKHRKKNRR
ncbi:MAG TPA: carboxypeptidase-like regulatory domain-containing protein [Solirubrobacterales bacterium]|nr:carboxypeptidase-like regulatory domain-containing protein [Solirubrobacterales bacterium]